MCIRDRGYTLPKLLRMRGSHWADTLEKDVYKRHVLDSAVIIAHNTACFPIITTICFIADCNAALYYERLILKCQILIGQKGNIVLNLVGRLYCGLLR